VSIKYPSAIDSSSKRALYDNLASNEDLAVELYNTINDIRPDNWIGSPIKEKAVRIGIRQVLKNYGITDEIEVSRIYDLVTNQEEIK
jgi:type I restriction enzyme R subunit